MTSTPQTTSQSSVELLVRKTPPAPVSRWLDVVIERLEALRMAGTIDHYRIERWPPDVGHNFDTPRADGPADERPLGRTRRELVSEFESWAEQTNRTLEPAFRFRTVHSRMTGSTITGERIRVPMVTLVGRDDEGIKWVAPCHTPDREQCYTVEDFLARLEADDEIPDSHADFGSGTSTEGDADEPDRSETRVINQ